MESVEALLAADLLANSLPPNEVGRCHESACRKVSCRGSAGESEFAWLVSDVLPGKHELRHRPGPSYILPKVTWGATHVIESENLSPSELVRQNQDYGGLGMLLEVRTLRGMGFTAVRS